MSGQVKIKGIPVGPQRTKNQIRHNSYHAEEKKLREKQKIQQGEEENRAFG